MKVGYWGIYRFDFRRKRKDSRFSNSQLFRLKKKKVSTV